jgi:hypothetical protein
VLHIKVENYKLDVLNRPRVYVGFNKTEDELLSLILQREESSSNHTGENVFGATMNVTAFRIKELAIAYDPNTAPNFYDFAIPLTPEKAQSVKPRVRMLIIGKLASPPIFEGTSYFGATLDASMSFHDDYSYIHLTIEDVWVFDSATGEILAKASAR